MYSSHGIIRSNVKILTINRLRFICSKLLYICPRLNRTTMKKQILLVAGAAILSTSAKAQNASVNKLDSIVIQENRITEPYGKQNRNLQVLDSKQIRSLPVKSTNELLAYLAGVDLRQRGPWGSQSDVSIDGSTFDQVLVLVNGVKMTDPQTGHHIMNLPIPLSAIDHIEVVRGPAARTYGVNALAGAINIVTKVPQGNTVFAQAYAGSSFQQDSATTAQGDLYFGSGAQVAASIAKENHSHLLSVAYDKSNGYRYNTGSEAARIYYQNKIVLGRKHDIEAMGGYVKNSFGANGYYAAPADVESTEEVETAMGSIKYNFRPTEKITISPRISYRYNNDDYIFVRQKPSLYHNIHETNVVTGEVQSSIKLNKGTIGLGVEYRNLQINSTNLGFGHRDNLGIFAEYKHYFSDRLNASAGLYANYNSDYDWQVFPGVDVGYYVAKDLKLFANATMGQRLPTYTDLYYKGPTNIGNATLQPEYAQYAEGGIQYSKRGLLLKGAYFYRRFTDFIDWVRVSPMDPWQPQNFQNVNTSGITFNANAELSELMGWSDNYRVSINANYTYLDPKIVKPNNDYSKYAIEALRHQATISVRSLLYRKVQANLTYRYLYRISANDYTVIDFRLGYQLKDVLIYADLNNLLNTQYKEVGAVQMPGSWYSIGVRLNTDWK